MRFGLIDYGSGNLRSVAKAITSVAGQVRIYDSPSGLEHEDALVLPGVGAFGDCVAQLRARQLWDPIAGWLREGRPFLGICLGYQLLFESSEESPGVAGLGHFAGTVRRLRSDSVKVPHIGWNTIESSPATAVLWRGLPEQPNFYFVHSYVPEPVDPAIIAATCDYGRTFAAAVTGPGPLLATQFHPEKSQRAGLTLLRNFIASIGTRASPERQASPVMLLLPAIDLLSGEVVRLRQGRAEEKTVFPGAPADWAVRWERAGGDWLHVVDLDAAFSGASGNVGALRAIVDAVKIPIELGGGMRDEASVRRALDLGVSRIVIGTRAVESLEFVREMVRMFGGERIAVGIDARDGLVAVKGWAEASTRRALELARDVAALGVGAIIYTDIATDGMMTGPNFAALDEMLAKVDCAVIASGGVARNEDLEELAKRARLHGTIIGRALYDGAIDLPRFRGAAPQDPAAGRE